MAAQSSLADGSGLSRRSPVRPYGLVQLGWPHFWLLGGILGGLLSLVALIFVL